MFNSRIQHTHFSSLNDHQQTKEHSIGYLIIYLTNTFNSTNGHYYKGNHYPQIKIYTELNKCEHQNTQTERKYINSQFVIQTITDIISTDEINYNLGNRPTLNKHYSYYIILLFIIYGA